MIDFTWFLENPEVGWIVVWAYLFWEIRGPHGKISELTKLIKNVVVVVRALARAQNKDNLVDINKVDKYLVENGYEPADFIRDEDEEDEELDQFTSTDD